MKCVDAIDAVLYSLSDCWPSNFGPSDSLSEFSTQEYASLAVVFGFVDKEKISCRMCY